MKLNTYKLRFLEDTLMFFIVLIFPALDPSVLLNKRCDTKRCVEEIFPQFIWFGLYINVF